MNCDMYVFIYCRHFVHQYAYMMITVIIYNQIEITVTYRTLTHNCLYKSIPKFLFLELYELYYAMDI